jgi:hypothetical protein
MDLLFQIEQDAEAKAAHCREDQSEKWPIHFEDPPSFFKKTSNFILSLNKQQMTVFAINSS